MDVTRSSRQGQSLVELLVAIGIGAILFVGAAALVAPSLQINKQTSQVQAATGLGEELLNNVKVFSEGNWNNLLSLATGSAHAYYLITSSSPFVATSGVESISISTTTFTRSFYLSDVYRDSNGNVTSTTSGNTYDPSTKQVSVVYNWTRGTTTTISAFLTRNRTAVTDQTDWSGGPGFAGPTTSTNAEFASSTNINYSSVPGALSVIIATPSTTYPNGYVYRRTITASSSLVAPSGTSLSNFPMLVGGTYSFLAASSSGGSMQNPNGYDIIFTSDASGTIPLNYEREAYASSTGAVDYWVQVPTLSSSSNVIYMFYDNPSVTTDRSNAAATWDSNYQAVFHFNNNAGSTVVTDSTGKQTGTSLANTNTMATSTQIDGGFGFNGTSNAVQVQNMVVASGSLTFSFWVDPGTSVSDYILDCADGNRTIIDNGNNAPNNNSLSFYDGAWKSVSSAGSLPLNATRYATIVMNSTLNMDIGYINGVETGTSTYTAVALSGASGNCLIGSLYAGNSNFYQGTLDEFRISNIARSPDWIATEYNNQASPSTFYTVGAATTDTVGFTSGSISSSTNQHWAWNDAIGWIDFYNNNNVGVNSTGLTGYASSSVGDIALDCATTRNGNICSPSFVQSTSTPLMTVTSISLKFPANPALNDLIVGAGTWGYSDSSNNTTAVCSDSAGNTYATTPYSYDSSNGQLIQICYAIVTKNVSSDTVTMAFPGSQVYLSESFAIHEYRGVMTTNPLDVSSNNVNPSGCAGTSCITSLASTTTQNGDLIFGFEMNSSGGAGVVTPGTSFTQREAFANSLALTEDTTQTINGSIAATFSFQNPNQGYLDNMAAFKTGSSYQVLNDGNGNLSGWGWNDNIGWISFCGGKGTANCPGTTNYETTIDSGGNFQGWAWNDDVGWISFNCDNNGGSCSPSYEVKTTWLPPSASPSTTGTLDSPTFDTGVASGAQFNSILWQGTQYSSSTVQFQFAVSNSSSGPWNYLGPDGTSNTYYTPTGPGDAVSLNDNAFSGYRYFRYQVFMSASASSSVVNDVVVNWSP